MNTFDFSRDESVVELTQALVRIPSENPTGDEVAVGRFIAELLETNGIETQVIPVEGKRANVIGRIRGAGGPPLVLIAHLDTVPIGERSKWKYDPFGAEIVEGKLYGRGSCDMKGGTAAAIVAMMRLKQQNVQLSGDLVLACTIDEETGPMLGSQALGKAKTFGADAYLLTMEPTVCELNIAHKGAYWYEATFSGKAAHAANPEFGADANRAMAEAISSWYSANDVFRAQYKHPLLGSPTLVVSVVQGGFKTNVVSEYCRAEIDVRVPPLVSEAAIENMLSEVGNNTAKKFGVEFAIRPLSEPRPPVECDLNSPLLAAFNAAYLEVKGEQAKHLGFLGYTDAAMLAILTNNKNSVVFGPGDLSNAHTVDEYVDVNQLYTALNVLEGTARKLLAV